MGQAKSREPRPGPIMVIGQNAALEIHALRAYMPLQQDEIADRSRDGHLFLAHEGASSLISVPFDTLLRP